MRHALLLPTILLLSYPTGARAEGPSRFGPVELGHLSTLTGAQAERLQSALATSQSLAELGNQALTARARRRTHGGYLLGGGIGTLLLVGAAGPALALLISANNNQHGDGPTDTGVGLAVILGILGIGAGTAMTTLGALSLLRPSEEEVRFRETWIRVSPPPTKAAFVLPMAWRF